jgi:predicted AlkP superfamily pyrophosphatase or phosphodiesterase
MSCCWWSTGWGSGRWPDTSPSPHLQRHLRGSMTSVFPSTTASAITTLMTGLAPAQHGLTGWHMHLDEIDQTLSILPLTPRLGPPSVLPERTAATSVRAFDVVSVAGRASHGWSRRKALPAARSMPGTRAARRAWPTNRCRRCLPACADLVQEGARSSYIYAYYPDLDSYSHHYGTDSRQAQHTLSQFDVRLRQAACAGCGGSSTWLLVTADHGFIDSPTRRVISLDDHPRLAALLLRPLCGERRAAIATLRRESAGFRGLCAPPSRPRCTSMPATG